MAKIRIVLFLFAILMVIAGTTNAQTQTVGLFSYDSASFEGYTLFAPNSITTTYLIDNYGRLVHSWASAYRPSASNYLLENGNLLKAARIPGPNTGGGFQELAWDGTVVWEYEYNTSDFKQHHDVTKLPNGNVLMLAWDYRTRAEAITAGLDSTLIPDTVVRSEHLVEVKQTGVNSGTIVWEWYVWDHIIQDHDSTKDNYGVVADHPELFDINSSNMTNDEILHANAVSYNADLDQIVISLLKVSEIWIIDHSTTTAEAASHAGGNNGKGGDLLYRWGNPQIYGRGTSLDRRFYTQHTPHWIGDGLPGAGNLLVYNNGRGRPDGDYSTIAEFTTPADGFGIYPTLAPGVAHEPNDQTIVYVADPTTDFYSRAMSGAQRMPNGNTLICESLSGRFFEVTPGGDIVWEYINPIGASGPLAQGEITNGSGNSVFRCYRYGADYPGLTGKDLTSGSLLELYPITVSGASHLPVSPISTDSVIITATITSADPITISQVQIDTGAGLVAFDMFDDGNHHDGSPADGLYGVSVPPYPELTTALYNIFAQNNLDSAASDPFNAPTIAYSYTVSSDPCCLADRGNANSDPEDKTNVADVSYLSTYLFGIPSGPAPNCSEEANANNDPEGKVNVSDISYLVAYLFGIPSGPAPSACP